MAHSMHRRRRQQGAGWLKPSRTHGMSNWPGLRMRRICRTVQTWLPQSEALPMTEAELDFAEVRRAFDHAATSYDAHAVLQREVCDRLLVRLVFFLLLPGRFFFVCPVSGFGRARRRARGAAAGRGARGRARGGR